MLTEVDRYSVRIGTMADMDEDINRAKCAGRAEGFLLERGTDFVSGKMASNLHSQQVDSPPPLESVG